MVEVDVEAPGPAAAADDWDLDPPEMSNQFYFVCVSLQKPSKWRFQIMQYCARCEKVSPIAFK